MINLATEINPSLSILTDIIRLLRFVFIALNFHVDVMIFL